MFNIGLFELMFFISFALIFLGPEKLLELLKTVYQFYHKLKYMLQHFQHDVERELKLDALQQSLEVEINKVRDLEKILTDRIYADLQTEQMVYVSVPYSSLGNIEALTPLDPLPKLLPWSYMQLNTQFSRLSFSVRPSL